MQLTCFDDTKKIAAVLREGRTIMLLDVSPLKEKDVIDLKRSVNKLKNVSAEMGSEIAGLSGDWIVLAPGFAEIYRTKPVAPKEEALKLLNSKSKFFYFTVYKVYEKIGLRACARKAL